ncbi:MAG: STAS domain-containing protein [Candidatus Latescibacteria bacterium]|nr:STAS domain-containing protein [Candidatus Latescibacterota bacterium]NIO56750.1 STAS domain-containing protein [Candidatus Latescibacterota bacterium]NIT02335.1 STAS domain-containing protein [Candidatus Latescibacterota bacterium]NIT39218.1 STAS domain-containing protein [Candidatus Latescibacterota bacterium]
MTDQFWLEETKLEHPIAVIRIGGRFGSEGAQKFRDFCVNLRIENYQHLVVDMTDVAFIASIGAGTLMIMTQVFTRINGTLQLVNLSEPVLRVVNLLNLDRFLMIKSSEKEALESVKVTK